MSRSAQATPVRRSSRSAALLVGLGSVSLLVVAAIALFELANWDKVTPGVTTLDMNVGGLSRPEAVARLTPVVEGLLDRPLDIRGSGQTWHTTPRNLGLQLDPNELVGAAYQVGRQGNPLSRLAEQLTTAIRGQAVSVASTADRPALDRSLNAMSQQIERPPTDARLTLAKDGSVDASEAQDGLAVDLDASRQQLTAALNSGSQVIELATRSVPPAVTDQQLQTARDQVDRLLGPSAQPITATFGDQSWTLERADVANLLSLTRGNQPDQPVVVNVDDTAVREWVSRLAKEVDQAVQNARFQFNGGNLKVLRPSRQGRSLDQDAAARLVHDALLHGEQTFALPVSVVEPTVSSDNPQALGITELIDKGSTSVSGSIPEKKANIKLAAQRLNGIVVAPGETFSFNKAVGPTTIDAGFQWGFGIESGANGPKTVPSVAGGICQVATTLFQPVFWSGYQLEERYWHLYWIPAYTSRGVVGLDVTVDEDSGIDFKWTNVTSTYILIQADADDSNVYFGLYGTKPAWKVQVDDAVISNRVPPDPKPIAQQEPTLPWGRTLLVETARDGFDAQVVRRVIPADGGKPRELSLKSTYQPAHTVTLVGTGGKPANASVDDAIARVLDAQKPAEAKASPTVGTAAATSATTATNVATPQAQATPAPSATQAQATPAPKAATAAPTAAPRATAVPPQKTPAKQAAASSNAAAIAPTSTPTR